MTLLPLERPPATPSSAAPSRAGRCRGQARALLPGLAATGVASAAAWGAHRLLPALAPVTAAVVLGVLAANLRVLPASADAGLRFAAKRLMRLAVALLGLKLALGDVLALGWRSLAMATAVVGITFLGTRWLGQRLGLPGDQPLLIATGFAICGASAIAAMNSVTDSEEDDVVTAVALVTLCGTLAIGVLPLLRHPLGLDPAAFGQWTGASVHDVGQVVATAQTAGPTALGQAVVVKLMRVALLAPLVAATAATVRHRRAAGPGRHRGRPPLVPLFVLCFLALAGLRSTGRIPAQVLGDAQQLNELLLAAGLFGLGSAVDVRRLLRTGGRALAVALLSWLLIAGVAYGGVLLTS